MSDCCNTSTGFPTADQMAVIALNHPIVWREICAIQQAILAAASQCQPGGGKLCTVIGGNTPMTFVSGLTTVDVIAPGSNYLIDRPAVKIIPPVGAEATDATAVAVTNGTSIMSITVTNGGVGYAPVNARLEVSSLNGTGAELYPLVDAAGRIVGINLVSGGLYYTPNDTVFATRAVLADPAYQDAVFKITSVSPAGRINSIAILNSGTGYQSSESQAVIVSSLNPDRPYPVGTGFSASVFTDAQGAVTDVMIRNQGHGYADLLPYMLISDTGTGAETQVTLTDDQVSSVTVTKSGTNYTALASGRIFNPETASLPNPPEDQAVVRLNVSVNTYNTDPLLYYRVWAGTTTDRQIQTQISTVVSYFEKLGYSVAVQTNPDTGYTLQWKLCW